MLPYCNDYFSSNFNAKFSVYCGIFRGGHPQLQRHLGVNSRLSDCYWQGHLPIVTHAICHPSKTTTWICNKGGKKNRKFQGSAFFLKSSLKSWVMFHCIYVPQFLYPFICNWTSRLLPHPSYCKKVLQQEHWGTCISHRELNPVLCDNLEGWDGVGDGSEVQEGGDYVYLWLTHVALWQKPAQYCKAIILQ